MNDRFRGYDPGDARGVCLELAVLVGIPAAVLVAAGVLIGALLAGWRP